ncbi:MAG: DUF4124 domain-containing protein [Gammaproteobacteria bacterium]|nr:DUF4124 domain-containing protein [Gammaproteobacteria bacterium]
MVNERATRSVPSTGTAPAALVLLMLLSGTCFASSTVYKWVDEYGTVHLSTSKPPAGVQYQTLNLGSSSSKGSGKASGGGTTAPGSSSVSPAQAAQRSEVLSNLQNRECVIALEALDRLTSGTAPTSATEITRLKQTTEINCSKDPAKRREQEQMAARLRVANGPECVAARNKLADMTSAGSKSSREQVKAQQAFVDEHCIPPVR